MSRSGWKRELTKNQKVEAALNNEQTTRRRVETLEAAREEDRGFVLRHVQMGFKARLFWLLRGHK